jgi:peptide/nickel transport system permease protein
VKLVFYWTDALVWLLLAMLGGFWLYVRRREHLRRPWRKILADRAAMASLVILLAYSFIGILDSVHFMPATPQAEDGNEPISLLDWCLTPLRSRDEKTYSAPLDWRAYSRESLSGAGGATRWDYPRLQFGGAHLADPEREWAGNVATRGGLGLLAGLGVWGVGIVAWGVRRAHLLPPMMGGEGRPRRAVAFTALFLCLFIGLLAGLATGYHPLGTDKVGQDVLYQSLKSIRTGLVIGTLTTLIMLPFALLLGIVAGYFRGWADDVIQYVYTTLNSIPGVLLIAAAILVTQVYMANHEEDFASLAARADLRLLFLCLILGVTSWTGLCRLLRAETLKLREMEFVQAARALGVSDWMILARHILPNVTHIVLISVALDFSSLVLAEAVLSYVNIGVDPATQSWGNMINSARLELARDPVVWWPLTAALLFMFTLVLAANLFADAVRDAFDPRRDTRRD